MFSRVPKSQKIKAKVQRTLYGPELDISPASKLTDITICSIDPGWKNFAIRIEERELRDNLDCCTIFADNVKFDSTFDTDYCAIFDEISEYLDKINAQLSECDIVLMERQMECNYKMVRVSQHILSYFRFNYPNTSFVELTPKYKTRKQCKFAHLNKSGIKKWAICYARELSKRRSDTVAVELLKSKKADDYADTIVQIDGYLLELGHKLTILEADEIDFEIS